MTLNEVPEFPDIAIRAGDTLAIGIHLADPSSPTKDPSAPGFVPADGSGWTYTAQWRERSSEASSIAFAVDASQAASGVIVLSMTPAQTRQMSHDGYWDLQGVRGEQVQTFGEGQTRWKRDVTRNG